MNTGWLKKGGWYALCLLLFAVAYGLWISKPNLPQVRLADGTVLRLECVRYKHKAAAPWDQWVQTGRKWIARALRRPDFSDAFAPPDSLVLWFSRLDKDGRTVLPFNRWGLMGDPIDSHGCQFCIAGRRMGPGFRSIGANLSLACTFLPVWPRREREFTLRLHDQIILGEIKVPNPSSHRYAKWKPESLPVTKPLGQSNVTLVNFENVWGSTHYGFNELQFSLTPEFQLPPEWILESAMIEDATGNCGAPEWTPQYGPSPRFLRHSPPWEAVSAQFGLCTNESAWKLSATFVRGPQAKFASNEIWTITNVPVPPAGASQPLGFSNRWQGVTVVLSSIAGPAEVTYSNGVPVKIAEYRPPRPREPGRPFPGPPPTFGVPLIPVSSDKPQLHLEVTAFDNSVRLLVMAKGADKSGLCPVRMASNQHRVLSLDAAEGQSAIDLCFIIHRPQVVEFFIKPKASQADAASDFPRPRRRPIQSGDILRPRF